MTRQRAGSLLIVALLFAAPARASETPARVVFGSKAFPESWILAEAAARLAMSAGGVTVEHRTNLGGTEIVYQALKRGSIDLYPEYTGTISEVVLKSPHPPTLPEMRAALAAQGIGMSEPLGFNDGYALAVRGETATRLHLSRLSDLLGHPGLRLGLTHEFLGRKDGFPGLAAHYGLAMRDVRGIQHDLAYEALATGKIDATDIYTTDAEIQRLGLTVLEDDRHFFPRYDAVFLYRVSLPREAPAAWAAIRRLEGRIDEAAMIRANAEVGIRKRPFAEAADTLLASTLGAGSLEGAGARGGSTWVSDLVRNALRHLELVGLSLLAAILFGIPLGVLATRSRLLAQLTLSAAGLLQTIPSLALLAFLIPVFGIGVTPALIALFLYGLLPVVRNTYVGLSTLPRPLLESAEVLGLTSRAQLLRIQLPMASPSILAGIKTSAVINVGTATLAALIGAGGLGEPILSGIQLRDTGLILRGALPAAALALLVQWGFDLLEHRVVPRGLRC